MSRPLERQRKPEASLKLATTVRGEGKGTGVEVLQEPSLLEREGQEGRADGAAEVGSSLAPVETGEGEASARRSGGLDIDSEGGKGLRAGGREAVGIGEPG